MSIESAAESRRVRIQMPQSNDVDESLEELDFETLAYAANWGRYRIRVVNIVGRQQRETLLALIGQARAFRA